MTENLVLEILKKMQGDMSALRMDIHEVKQRLSSLESHMALIHGDFANQSHRIDRIEQHIERINRRLELQD